MSKLVKTEIGFLPKNWAVVTLGEIADVIDPHPSHRAPKVVDNGYPFAGIGDIDEYGNIRVKKARQISEEFILEQERSYEINEYSIGYGRVGTVGKVVKLRKQAYRYALSPTLAVINPKNNVNPRFVYCLVRTKNFYHQVLNHMTGTTRPAIGIQLLRKIKVPLPSPEEQNQIAESICSLDDKIEINTKTNQTLEQIAQALFKSWFVDFDPVKAKIAAKQAGGTAEQIERAAMAAISGKTEPELDQLTPEQIQNLKTTAALFPDELVDSEQGEIPKGWMVKSLDEIAHYQNGLALQKFRPENEKDAIPVLKIAQLKKGFADGDEQASSKIKAECIVNNGDIVFSWSGSLMVDIWCGGKVALNQHLFKVTSTDYPKWFYYYYTKHHLAEFQQIAQAKAVTMGHIKREHLKQAVCAVPDVVLLESLGETIAPLLDKAIAVRLENRTLVELRDKLLPQLISGCLFLKPH